MDQYQIWKNDSGRMYEIYLHRDLFNWVINLAWGSVLKKSSFRTLSFNDYDEAVKEFNKQIKRRKSHKYFLTGQSTHD